MIPFASYLITAAVSATLAVSAALYVQGNRHKVEILEIQRIYFRNGKSMIKYSYRIHYFLNRIIK